MPYSIKNTAFLAAALWGLYPENRVVRFATILCAFVVSIGVSVTIHWFSEFVAGAIIGLVVGKSFHRRTQTQIAAPLPRL